MDLQILYISFLVSRQSFFSDDLRNLEKRKMTRAETDNKPGSAKKNLQKKVDAQFGFL